MRQNQMDLRRFCICDCLLHKYYICQTLCRRLIVDDSIYFPRLSFELDGVMTF